MIELHKMISGDQVLVNVNAISCVIERDEGVLVYTICSEDDHVYVSESYNKVKNLIRKVVTVVS